MPVLRACSVPVTVPQFRKPRGSEPWPPLIHTNQGSRFGTRPPADPLTYRGLLRWCQADEEPGHFRATDKPQADPVPLEYTLNARFPGGSWFFLGSLQIDNTTGAAPGILTVDSIFPNPFNPQVNILFTRS